jgi:hypothetical protein
MGRDNSSVLHLVDPIADPCDRGIVRDKEKRFPATDNNVLQQFESPRRILGVEVAGRLVGQDDARIIGQRARDRDALLLATGRCQLGRSLLPDLTASSSSAARSAFRFPLGARAAASGIMTFSWAVKSSIKKWN